MSELDQIPMDVPNPGQFEAEVKALWQAYERIRPAVLDLVRPDAPRHDMDALGNGAERLDDFLPNYVAKLYIMADMPNVGTYNALLAGMPEHARSIMDMAELELKGKVDPADFKDFHDKLFSMNHYLQSWPKPVVGPRSAAVAAEDRSGGIKR